MTPSTLFSPCQCSTLTVSLTSFFKSLASSESASERVNNSNAFLKIIQAPIRNREANIFIDQFDFSDGFTVVPPPTDPYLPSSKPLLTEFIPNFNINGSNSQAGPNTKEFGFSGDIGNGDHGLTGCFRFNFYGASFGCDSRGPDCEFTFTGFRYDRDTMQTNQVAQKGYSIPACPALQDCSLAPIKFTGKSFPLDFTFSWRRSFGDSSQSAALVASEQLRTYLWDLQAV